MLLLNLPKVVFNFFVCFYYFLYIYCYLLLRNRNEQKNVQWSYKIINHKIQLNIDQFSLVSVPIIKFIIMFVLSLYLNKNIYYLIYGYPACIHVRYSEQRKNNVIGWLINPDNLKILSHFNNIIFICVFCRHYNIHH